jgi:hypothetical protein
MSNLKKILMAASLFGLAACATPPPPPPEAVVQLTERLNCTDTISLAGAVALTSEQPVGTMTRMSGFNPETPCVSTADGYRTYTVFALPQMDNLVTVNAGSAIEARRTLAVNVHVLDASGQRIESYDHASMRQRGTTWSTLFRVAPNARYVVLETDETRIGEALSLTASTSDPDTVIARYMGPTSARVGDLLANTTVNWSYEGTSFVRLYFEEPATPAG